MGGGLQIGWCNRERHQQKRDKCERQAQAEDALSDEPCRSLPYKARPHKQTRNQEERRHHEHVHPGTQNVEGERHALRIDQREGAPQPGRGIECVGFGREKTEIGKEHVKADDQQNYRRTQIVDGRNRARLTRNPLRLGVHDALRMAMSSGFLVSSGFWRAFGFFAWRGGPISTGWNSTAASMVQTSESDISWPMLDVPG